MKIRALSIVLLGLVGCSAGPTLTNVAPPAQSNLQSMYFMTTRAAVADDRLFGEDRAATPTFGEINIGIPPIHQPGQVETTDGVPDPARHFYNAGVMRYADARALKRAVSTEGRPTVVFVHGYNNTFAESTFRFAQILNDLDRDITPVHVSWASRGSSGGYVYDRDSALIARDDLADLLVLLATSNDNGVTLAAHSMGSLVAVEALIQLSKRREAAALSNVNRVLLVAPDLDGDLFTDQMAQVAYPTDQIFIAVNQGDRALALSGRITGNQNRLGRDFDTDQLEQDGYRVVDLSEIDDGDVGGHFLLASSPTLLGFLSALQPLE